MCLNFCEDVIDQIFFTNKKYNRDIARTCNKSHAINNDHEI